MAPFGRRHDAPIPNSEAAAVVPPGGTTLKAFGAVPSRDPPLGKENRGRNFSNGWIPVHAPLRSAGQWPSGTVKGMLKDLKTKSRNQKIPNENKPSSHIRRQGKSGAHKRT